jgi:hypothetical protein
MTAARIGPAPFAADRRGPVWSVSSVLVLVTMVAAACGQAASRCGGPCAMGRSLAVPGTVRQQLAGSSPTRSMRDVRQRYGCRPAWRSNAGSSNSRAAHHTVRRARFTRGRDDRKTTRGRQTVGSAKPSGQIGTPTRHGNITPPECRAQGIRPPCRGSNVPWQALPLLSPQRHSCRMAARPRRTVRKPRRLSET